VARLIAFADAHGLDARRGVAVNAVLADGSIHDPVARLWAQAERIRAYLAHRRSGDEVAGAVKGLRRFLATPTHGVWFDQLAPDDGFVFEPARATSLYHSWAQWRNSRLQFLIPGLQALSQGARRKRVERVRCCSKPAIARTQTSNR
jgi:mannose/cellobiose epimerase-like protein (N-acyl-D-glucosamine 2-epimerase family)